MACRQDRLEGSCYRYEGTITIILNEMCPITTIPHHSKHIPWLSTETTYTMKERDKVRETARQTQNPATWQQYRILRNKVNSMVDNNRKSYYRDKYNKLHDTKDISGTYKAAKVQVGWKANATPVTFSIEGRKVTSPQEIANIQLEIFRKKTEKLLNQLPAPTQDPLTSLEEAMEKWEGKSSRPLLKFKTLSKLEILEIINKFSYNNSTGHDELDVAVIKHGAGLLHEPITHVVNLSITSESFASKWKIGQLLPLHKGKGLKNDDPESYRPIYLLPVISKITERAIQPQIMDFM